jgi:hypothetical protein
MQPSFSCCLAGPTAWLLHRQQHNQKDLAKHNHRAAAIRDSILGDYIDSDLRMGSAAGVILAPGDMQPTEWIEEQKLKNTRIDQLMNEIEREEAGRS